MATHPLAAGPHVVHAPNLTVPPPKRRVKPGDLADEADEATKKPPAEKKPGATKAAGEGGGRSDGFGQGSGQHGQSPTIVHNHYYNPGNVFHGNVTNSTVHGQGGAYVQGNNSGNVAGRDINIGKKGAVAGAGGATGAPPKTAAPRTRKPRQPTSKATPASAPGTPQSAPAGALEAGPQGRASQAAADAEAARQGKPPRTFTPAGRPAPAELGGSQSRPGGGAPAAASRKPLALGAAPVPPAAPKQEPAPEATLHGKVIPPDQPAAPPPPKSKRKSQPVNRPGEGVVITGEVVKDEPTTKTTTPTKRKRATQTVTPSSAASNVPLNEGGNQGGQAGPLPERHARYETRRETGPSGAVNALAAAAIRFSPTTTEDATSRVANPVSKVRHVDPGTKVDRPAPVSPASTALHGSAIANIGTQTKSYPLGHPENPHKGVRVSPKGTQITLSPESATKVEKGHHVEVNGTKYRVGGAIGGSDLQRRHIVTDQS